MSPRKRQLTLRVEDNEISVIKVGDEEYVSLTQMTANYGGDRAIASWLRTKNTIEFLGLWESLNNPAFKPHEFVGFKNEAGSNSFNPSPKQWIQATDAIGIISKQGRGGGTYAHRDIALEFGTWLSPKLKLLMIKEFQRLKAQEEHMLIWDSRRYLSKVNYRLHTSAIKDNLLQASTLPTSKTGMIYADEADLLNVIVFGKTAAEWRLAEGKKTDAGTNQRDYATIDQLVLLANLENINSMYISQGKPQYERLRLLSDEGKRQRRSLLNDGGYQEDADRS